MKNEKQEVHDFWNRASCGEELYLPETDKDGYKVQAESRYALEPYITDFAGFKEVHGLSVLEIGVGLGADHQQFAEMGANLWGIDLTERAIEHTRRRLAAYGLSSNLAVGDAENLAFSDNSFDRVYSWGVLHHSPDTPKAIAEVLRVLKHGGGASVMIYHKYSMVGFMLWARYALLGLKPWLSLSDIYARYLESPGTKGHSHCKHTAFGLMLISHQRRLDERFSLFSRFFFSLPQSLIPFSYTVFTSIDLAAIPRQVN